MLATCHCWVECGVLATHVWGSWTLPGEMPCTGSQTTSASSSSPMHQLWATKASSGTRNAQGAGLAPQATTATSVTVLAPPDATIAPPGYYMLFLVSALGTPSPATFVLVSGAYPATDTLASGGELTTDATLQSLNNQYYLTLQADGNLVLYSSFLQLQYGASGQSAIWSSGTSGAPNGPFHFSMQGVRAAPVHSCAHSAQRARPMPAGHNC